MSIFAVLRPRQPPASTIRAAGMMGVMEKVSGNQKPNSFSTIVDSPKTLTKCRQSATIARHKGAVSPSRIGAFALSSGGCIIQYIWGAARGFQFTFGLAVGSTGKARPIGFGFVFRQTNQSSRVQRRLGNQRGNIASPQFIFRPTTCTS